MLLKLPTIQKVGPMKPGTIALLALALGIVLLARSCPKPNTAEWSRTPIPDGALDAVIGWEEDMAGATGGSGTTKVVVVPHGAKADMTGEHVASFYTNDSETAAIKVAWKASRHLEITVTDYEILDSDPDVTVIQKWKTEAAYHPAAKP